MKKHKSRFSVSELFLALALLVIVGTITWLSVYDRTAHKIPQAEYASYSDCVDHHGQLLSYDGAIQFSACKGDDNSLQLQYSAQDMPNISENKTTTMPNVVVSTASNTSDLIRYLTYSYTGCTIGQPAGSTVTGYYKIVKELPSGWALLNYGCTNATQAEENSSYIIAMKLSSGWVQLSPTNNFSPDGTPSCLLVDMFKIPSALVSQCYQNTGYSDGSLRSVTY